MGRVVYGKDSTEIFLGKHKKDSSCKKKKDCKKDCKKPCKPKCPLTTAQHCYPGIADASVSLAIFFEELNDPVLGSGFLYVQDGTMYVITVAHFVMDVSADNPLNNPGVAIHGTISNFNGKGESYVRRLSIVGVDGAADVAVLKFDSSITDNTAPDPKLQAHLTIETSQQEYGATALLLGQPLGEDQLSISQGIIRDPSFTGNPIPPSSILVDTPSYVGNSGGPILNCECKVIGLSSYSFIDTANSDVADGFSGGVNGHFLNLIVTTIIDGSRLDTTYTIPRFAKGFIGLLDWNTVKVAQHAVNFANPYIQSVGNLSFTGTYTGSGVDNANYNPADTYIRYIDGKRMGQMNNQHAPGDITYEHVPGELVNIVRVDNIGTSPVEVLDTITLIAYPPELDMLFSHAV
jgi:hypothetical protein